MTIWAWATPAWFKDNVLDHTWVTTYDNRLPSRPENIEEVVKAGELYWFCWGDFHAYGKSGANGYLCSQDECDLEICQALVTPNLPSAENRGAQGTIYHYGIDGVCHQLANQTLWATGLSNGGTPLTVAGARGYDISNFLFGTYGYLTEDQWQQRIAPYVHSGDGSGAVLPPGPHIVNESIQMPTSENASLPGPSEDDDFSRHARRHLTGPDSDAKFKQLHALRMRQSATLDVHRMRARSNNLLTPSPEELNAHYTEVLRQAALFLDPIEFKSIFGIDPGSTVALVPPSPATKP